MICSTIQHKWHNKGRLEAEAGGQQEGAQEHKSIRADGQQERAQEHIKQVDNKREHNPK